MSIYCKIAGFVLGSFASGLSFSDSVQGDNGAIEIQTLLHSSVQLEYQGMVIQVDPWDRLGLEGAKPADLILITDDVDHHLDQAAISRLRKPGATIVVATNGADDISDGLVLANGESREVTGVRIEAVAAYDIIPGAPEHPKGEANGYLVTLGGKRIFFAGVTECVDEVKALEGVDVAFLPMNIPVGRMVPAAVAECARILNPEILYVYHYDQDYVRRLSQPDYVGSPLPDNLTVAQTLEKLRQDLQSSAIELRIGNFYPQ